MKNPTKITLLLSLLVSLIAISSCSTNASLKKDLAGIMGREVFLPVDLQATFNGVDTVLTGFTDSRSKMVIYYDPAGCNSCVISRMYEWRAVIATSLGTLNRFNAIFIFAPKEEDVRDVRISLMSAKLDYPVFLDLSGEFAELNPDVATNGLFHRLLLDGDNRVLLVGNPVGNDALWELYKETIREQLRD